MRLDCSFYNRHVVDVAKNFLEKTFVFSSYQGMITQIEAYRKYDNEASHAYKCRTSLSQIMFDEP